jgi:hypothetical protein
VEIIQERIEEEEPELGLLAQLACAAEPTGASLSSEHKDRQAALPRQLHITKNATEPSAGAGARSGPEAYT